MSRLERIVSQYGGILLDNGKRALICGPGHGSKDRSVSLKETEDGRILIHCFSPKDDWRAVRRALAEKGLLDDEAAPTEKRAGKVASPPPVEDKLARAERLWAESRPAPWT
ncbi:MAG TPA: virulence-associated protein E, partial [Hyphomonadaceae bacterium]|nr:virulence-associated protein E [Hyphomonadaceae bacterium]